MSIPGLIYIVGSILAVIIVLRWLLHEDKGNITVEDMFFMIVILFIAGLISWVVVLLFLISKYKDKVVFFRREEE